MQWRRNFLRSYLERDIPQFGVRIPAETLRRFLTMLAHHQSSVLNAASLARNLAIDGKTVLSHLDLMVDLMLVRRLPAALLRALPPALCERLEQDAAPLFPYGGVSEREVARAWAAQWSAVKVSPLVPA